LYDIITNFYSGGGETQEAQAKTIIYGFMANSAVDLLDEEVISFLSENTGNSLSGLVNMYKSCVRILDEEWITYEANSPLFKESKLSSAKSKICIFKTGKSKRDSIKEKTK